MKYDFNYTFVAYLILSLIIISSAAYAGDINGSLSTEFYNYEDSSGTNIQPYVSVNSYATLWKGSNLQSITFNTYLRYRTNLQNNTPSQSQLFVYDSYFRLSNIISKTYFTFGRQYVFSSAGSSLIDGLRTVYKSNNYQLDLFAGSKVDLGDPEKINSFDKHLTMGGRIATSAISQTNIGLNWFYRKYDSETAYSRFSLDLNRNFRFVDLYTRVGWNFDNQRIAEILARIKYNNKSWYLSGEFKYREPSILQNSIFNIIDANKYKNLRLELHRKLTDRLRLLSYAKAAIYDDDNSYAFGIGIRTLKYSVIYHHQSGRGTSNNGLSSSIYWPINKKIYGYASLNLFRYKIQEATDEKSDAVSSIAGVQYKLSNDLTITGEWQLLRNAVAKSDSRFRIKLTKGFSFDW